LYRRRRSRPSPPPRGVRQAEALEPELGSGASAVMPSPQAPSEQQGECIVLLVPDLFLLAAGNRGTETLSLKENGPSTGYAGASLAMRIVLRIRCGTGSVDGCWVVSKAGRFERRTPALRATAGEDFRKKTFEIDVEPCTQCSCTLTILAAIEDVSVIAKILAHLGLSARAPPPSFDRLQRA
jgi:hypothetical protein